MLAIGIFGWRKIVKSFDEIKDGVDSVMTEFGDASRDRHTTACKTLPCATIKCPYLFNIQLRHVRWPELLLA